MQRKTSCGKNKPDANAFFRHEKIKLCCRPTCGRRRAVPFESFAATVFKCKGHRCGCCRDESFTLSLSCPKCQFVFHPVFVHICADKWETTHVVLMSKVLPPTTRLENVRLARRLAVVECCNGILCPAVVQALVATGWPRVNLSAAHFLKRCSLLARWVL